MRDTEKALKLMVVLNSIDEAVKAIPEGDFRYYKLLDKMATTLCKEIGELLLEYTD